VKKLDAILSLGVVLIIFTYAAISFGIPFLDSGITGHQVASTRLVIITREQTYCNMTLEPGWNLISFPCISDDLGINEFFLGYNETFDTLRYYTPSDALDPWKSYNPNLPSWAVQDLSSLSREGGYWIYLENTTNYYINRTLTIPSIIPLQEGWNLIGYPSRTEKPINDTFDQIIPDFDYVYLYNASDQIDKWKEYTWNSTLAGVQDLNHSVMYYGYWVYMLESDDLVIS
jgi:hypothetical protein